MTKKAFDKIGEGLNETLAVASGDAAHARLHVPTQQLKERFARLGPVRDISRVPSGSSVEMVLRRAGKRIDTVTATLELAKYGLSMLRAKRAIETLIEAGEVRVVLPTVPFALEVIRDLKKTGVDARQEQHRESP